MSNSIAKLGFHMERMLEKLVGLKDAMPPTKHEALTAVGLEYGFHVVTDSEVHDNHLCFTPCTPVQQDEFAQLLRNEFAFYNRDVIDACGIQRVILCQNLAAGDQRLAGLAEVGLFLVDSFVLDAAILRSREGRDREVFHHELFHAMDYRDDLSHYVDTDWFHLNAPGFRYNADLNFRDMPTFDHRDVAEPEAGFLNAYSTQNPYEDKATIYANLIVYNKKVMERAAHDEVLTRKIEYMKQLLQRFNPHFDDAFWDKVRAQHS